MKSKTKLNIIWSVDAFIQEKEGLNNMVQTLKALSKIKNLSITPVYVLSPDQFNLPVEFAGPWLSTYKPAVEKALDQMFQSIQIEGLEKPEIIKREIPSLKNSVKALAAFAKSRDADLILAGTHGRHGLSRVMLGSFAESLLLQSDVPVLVVGPEAQAPQEFKNIIFPTDLGKTSQAIYPQILNFAKTLGSQVTLFHAVLNPIEPAIQSGVYLFGGGWVPVPFFLEKQKEKQSKKAAEWAEKGKKLGVHVEVCIDTTSRSVTQSTIEYCQNNHGSLIAMAAQSGPFASALIGSITRQIVRSAHCPVWVLRPGKSKKKK